MLPSWLHLALARVASLLVIFTLTRAAFGQLFNGPFNPEGFELSQSIQVSEVDNEAKAHLERVRAFLAAEQWNEAIETLQSLLTRSRDRVIAVEPRRYINLPTYCQKQLAALPAVALRRYRDRVDATAKGLYERGLAQRDKQVLERVATEFFASRWGDDALLMLGELALEAGDATRARGSWELLVELPPERIEAATYEQAYKQSAAGPQEAMLVRCYEKQDESFVLKPKQLLNDKVARDLVDFWKEHGVTSSRVAYPGTSIALADIRARLVLASILEGSMARARGELDAFKQLHPDAVGMLAGRKVIYLAGLEALLAAADAWRAPIIEKSWSTFAGNPDRQQVAPRAFDLGTVAWPAIRLAGPLVADAANLSTFSPRRIAERTESLLSFHPVLADNLVLVSTDYQVFAYDVRTGKPAFAGAPSRPAGEIYYDESFKNTRRFRGALGVPRFTLTVAGQQVFAKLGSPVTSRPVDVVDANRSALVCLNLAREGSLEWTAEPDGADWAFEGPPVVAGQNVLIAMRRSDVHAQAHVACLSRDTGKLQWRRFVCSADTPAGGQMAEITHNLLTLDHGRAYFNTNLGAVACLQVATGDIEWLSLYPRSKNAPDETSERTTATFLRDLNPCVFYRGLLLVAPSDSDTIFSLDALTGRMRWQTHLGDDAVHLLGVGKDNLIASGDSLWWINVYTGKVTGHFPEAIPPMPPFGYGRGLLAGDQVYWPTRDYLYVFDQAGPRTAMHLGSRAKISLVEGRRASGGNLVLADRVLLIADGTSLYGISSIDTQPAPLVRAGRSQASATDRATGTDEVVLRPAVAFPVMTRH